MILLRGERMLERTDRALAFAVLLLVCQRGLEHRTVPPLRAFGDIGDGELRVAFRQALGSDVDPRRLCRCRRRGARRGLLADRRDLDLRQRGPEARVPLVAGLRLVLADPHLRTAHVPDDLGRHVLGLRREHTAAVAAEEENLGVEGLALLAVQALDQETLALVDDVLLPSEADDRVVLLLGHGSQKRGPVPAKAHCSWSPPGSRPILAPCS